MTVTVENIGNSISFKKNLRYYVSTDSKITTRDSRISVSAIDPIKARGSITIVKTSLSLKSSNLVKEGNSYYVGACVEKVDNNDNESKTTDDCSKGVKVSLLGKPDLVVQSPSVNNKNPAAGSKIKMTVTVKNQGSAKALKTRVFYYFSSNDRISVNDRGIHSKEIKALSKGESSRIINEEITLPSNLTIGATRYLGACVRDVSNESDTNNNCSNGVSITISGVPKKPPSLSKAASTQGNKIQWTLVSGATYYEIYHSGDGNNFRWAHRIDDSNDNDWVDNIHSKGNDFYKVKACNSYGCSAYSNQVVFGYESAPAQPKLSKMVFKGTDYLTWGKVDNAKEYKIYRWLTKIKNDYSTHSYSELGTLDSTYWNIGIRHEDREKYYNYYRIKACNDEGCSDYSDPVRYDKIVPLDRPKKPRISKGYYDKDSKTKRIEWTQPTGGTAVEYYEVWRDEGFFSPWKSTRTTCLGLQGPGPMLTPLQETTITKLRRVIAKAVQNVLNFQTK